MDLYHDEYSVFYEYEDACNGDDNKRNGQLVNGKKSGDGTDDVIEVPSDSDGEEDEMHVQATVVNGKGEAAESDFDEDFDEDGLSEDPGIVDTSVQDLDFPSFEDDDEDCDTQMTSQTSNNCETLENNDGTYRCPLCPKEVVSKYNLKRHMMIHTGEKPHKCPTCYKGFREQSDLRKHKKVHIYGNRLFECNICFRSYQSYKANKCYYCDGDDEDLLPPNTYEDDSKLYNCFLCNATQLTTTQLKQHLIQVHPATSRVTYTTNSNGVTSNGSSSASSTNVTKSTHASSKSVEDMEKIHKCNVCSKAFRSKQFLMLHTLTHANNRIESAF